MNQIVRGNKGYAVAGLLTVALLVGGCAATRQRRGEPENTGFLGDYSELKPNPNYPNASAVYVRPGVQWSRYNSIQIDSVGLWVSPETENLSPQDQQMLTDTLYKALYDELSKYFVIVKEPGPNTLRLRAALTQAQGAKVGLRVITTVVPQLRMLGGVVGLAGDTASTVGSATVEMELLDSVTDQRLAAAVDARAGTKVLFAKRAYSTWGDVDTACQYWAGAIAWRFGQMGIQRKPGAPIPPEPSKERTI